jgi:hypothetical protein
LFLVLPTRLFGTPRPYRHWVWNQTLFAARMSVRWKRHAQRANAASRMFTTERTMVSNHHDTTIALRNLPESRSRAIDLAGMLRGTLVESRKIGQHEHFLLMGLSYAFQRYLYGSDSGDTSSLLFELSNAKVGAHSSSD